MRERSICAARRVVAPAASDRGHLARRARLLVWLPALFSVLNVEAGQGSVWGGRNGVLRLMIADGDSLRAAAHMAPGPQGLVLDLFAVLDGVDMVFWEGRQVRAIGGFELQLVVDGGPATITLQPLCNERGDTLKTFNFANGPHQFWVGLYPELAFQNRRATIAHWQVHLLGEARPIAFRLEPAGLFSCATLPGCQGSGASAIWAGSAAAHMAGLLFGAGHVPAYLNWETEPDLSPVNGEPTWRATGLFTEQ